MVRARPEVTAPSATIGDVKVGTKGEVSSASILLSWLVSTSVHLRPGPPALEASIPLRSP